MVLHPTLVVNQHINIILHNIVIYIQNANINEALNDTMNSYETQFLDKSHALATLRVTLQ